jgi:hypothetical protein
MAIPLPRMQQRAWTCLPMPSGRPEKEAGSGLPQPSRSFLIRDSRHPPLIPAGRKNRRITTGVAAWKKAATDAITRNLILRAFSVYFPVSLFLLAFVFNLSPLPDDQDKNLVQE